MYDVSRVGNASLVLGSAATALRTTFSSPRKDAWLTSLPAPSVTTGLAAGKIVASSFRKSVSCSGVTTGI